MEKRASKRRNGSKRKNKSKEGQRQGGNRADGQECPSHSVEPIELQAVGVPVGKRLGEAIEAAFLAKAASFDFAVAKPWGDARRYDFVVEHEQGFWRAQVKGTGHRNRRTYRLTLERRGRVYTADEIDFVVAYIIPEELWYIVPIELAAGRRSLYFSPHSKRSTALERYVEAWCLLACTRNVRGWKDIPVLCRCRELPARCVVCPLRK
jgi:PD-(D/E)XK nuclease superfamily protein